SLEDVAVEARLALLAIGDDVDAGRALLFHDVRYRLARELVEGGFVVGLPQVLRLQQGYEGIRAREAPDVGGEDAFGAALHEVSSYCGVRPALRATAAQRCSSAAICAFNRSGVLVVTSTASSVSFSRTDASSIAATRSLCSRACTAGGTLTGAR